MEPVFQTVEVEEITECYRIIKRLGEGAYGQVLLAQDKLTGKSFALKLVRKDRTKLKSFLMELSLSISLSENLEFILTYPIFTHTMDYYAMTQELATAGTLHHLFQAEVGLSEEMVKRCAVQISSALDYMHHKGLVHRDLKPDNVLLMDRDCHHIVLGDFGLTQPVGSIVTSMSHIIPYMSPELCDISDEEYLILHPSVDTWAFGILFVTLTGYYPWRRAFSDDIMYLDYVYWLDNLSYIPPPARWDQFSRAAITMLRNLLVPDQSCRHSVLSVLNYINFPWKTDVNGGNPWEAESPVDCDSQPIENFVTQNQEGTTSNHAMEADNPVLIITGEDAMLTLGLEVEIS
ncbi:serine/threonine-protein kinase SBK1-like [Engystomops pustulosus]|uniref:serine/threonine-protein kinase SBK1-like n=1 Tax=Engystomops pustulosus TaxID=76066 RepID=UPI003AFAFC46